MSLADLIPGVSQAKAIIGGAVIAALLAAGAWGWRINHLRAEHLTALHESEAWQTNVQSVTSHAAGASGLIALDQVPVQIAYLGQANADLTAKIASQNAAIEALADSTAAKVKAGNEALARVEAASQATQKAATALRASAAANVAADGKCKPSDAFVANKGRL